MFVRPELRPLLFAARISSPARTVDPVATATAVVVIVVAVVLPIKVVAAVALTVIAAAAVVVPRCAEELLSQIEMTETFRPDWTERKW